MTFDFRLWLVVAGVWAVPTEAARAQAPPDRPNIVIVMADDMGWRDTGYQGNPVVKTPCLDEMSTKGMRFDYFYPGQQMCSPGRFALLSGRNPFRTGLHHLGATRPEEIFLPRALKSAGYQSAHFGKWHLGGGKTSPVQMGFDQAIWSPNFFDLGAHLQVNDSKESVELKGDSSVAVMELALEYIRKQAKGPNPFLVQVCFGSPHSPHRATEEFKALYKGLPEQEQNFWGEISGLDAAVGTLRAELRKLGIADNTIVWFTSDNGGINKQSMDPSGRGKMTIGCRTVALLEWPARVPPQRTSVVAGHVDIYPTLLDIAGVKVPNQPVLDGISLVPLLEGKMTERPRPLGFLLWNGKGNFNDVDFVKHTQGVWIDGKFKLIVNPDGSPLLYDIYADPAHKVNLAEQHADVVQRMRKALDEWRLSVRASYDGKDFARQ
jgi:arylsulfatase A-like enzyme